MVGVKDTAIEDLTRRNIGTGGVMSMTDGSVR
jgi:hypothetical protein